MDSDNETDSLCVAKECERTVGDCVTVYRLCVFRFAATQYYVEICRDGERAAAYLGEDASAAHALYARLVRGTVTPCTLCDIVQDARFAGV